MKKLYFTSLLLGLILAFSSCEDAQKNYTDEFNSVLTYRLAGVRNFDFHNINEDVAYSASICKGGHNISAQPVAYLTPFTLEELKEYNAQYVQNYELLPEAYYTLPKTLAFISEEQYKQVDVIFKSTIGTELDYRNKEYVLPIHLTSDIASIYPEKQLLILRPNVITPKISLEKTGLHKVGISLQEGDETVTFDIPVSIDLKENKWAFSANFEQKDTELTNLVSAFNTEHRVNYGLLPASNRTFQPSLSFVAGEQKKTLSVTFNKEDLEMGDYLLPITLNGCSNMPFDVSDKVCYIHVLVTDVLPKISLTKEMLAVNSQETRWGWDIGDGYQNLVDEKLDTKYQSIWCSGLPTGANQHPTYGVYLDIKLTKSLNKQIAFKYWTHSDNNNVPSHIVIYAGKNESDLVKITEVKKLEDKLPTARKESYESAVYSLSGFETSLIRFAIIKNCNGQNNSEQPLTKNALINGAYPAVSISELELYGK